MILFCTIYTQIIMIISATAIVAARPKLEKVKAVLMVYSVKVLEA